MRLTIIPSDKNVGINNEFIIGLDLSNCGIPTNIHALQWYETEGEVEFIDNPDRTKPMNQVITELPSWANNCTIVWQEEKKKQEILKQEQTLKAEELIAQKTIE